jgi:glycosyltransferase involved in cell wall biosynthesis
MPAMPKVTVLMPVYNGEKYLRQAIDSILSQTFSDFEFIIIDDGSTDKSLEIIISYQDSRICIMQNGTNQGLVSSLNKGLNLAKGKYIARMDCDDISLPERLAQQVNFLEQNTLVSVLGTAAQIIDSNNHLDTIINFPETNFLIQWNLCFSSPLVHPSIMMRNDICKRVNYYTSDVIYGREKYSGEDYDLWRRLSKITQLANLPNVLLHLRKHESNLTKVYKEEHIKNAVCISKLIIEDTLGKEISSEIVRSLLYPQQHYFNGRAKAYQLIDSLYNSFIKQKDLSKAEHKLIQEDMIKRLISLSLVFKDYNFFATILLLKIQKNPKFLINFIANKIVNKIKNNKK